MYAIRSYYEIVDVVAALVLVFQIIRVLPHVADEQGHRTPLCQVLMLFGLKNDEAFAQRFVGENAPARALDRLRRLRELRLQGFRGSEVPFDPGEERTCGLAARSCRGHVFPEHFVKDVSRTVEGGFLGEAVDEREIAFRARVGHGGECGVETFHVARMMHIVVQAHRLGVDVRFERVIGVRQGREGVFTVLGDRRGEERFLFAIEFFCDPGT